MNKPALVLEKAPVRVSLPGSRPDKVNNFDLIRLLAALQVVFHHSFTNFGLSRAIPEIATAHHVINYFPGVSIFFTISGFLVYWSFDRNQDKLGQFFRNRGLRIYPALWVCVLVSVILIFIFNHLDWSALLSKDFWIYLFCQGTMFQTYFSKLSPVFGNGIPNGSLWTITIEVQFYLLIPVIYYICSRGTSKKTENIRLFILFACVFAVTAYARTLELSSREGQLMYSFVVPYLFNFIAGILIFRNFDTLKKFVENKFLYWFGAYAVYCLVLGKMTGLYVSAYWPDLPGLGGTALLSMVVISAAYTRPGLSKKILKGNDISYGVYIYHLLIINSLIMLNVERSYWALFIIVFLTILLAWLSWVFVEKKALQYK